MKQTNICKFISPDEADRLTVTCFVLEANTDVLSQRTFLSRNRAILIISGEGVMTFAKKEVPFQAGCLLFGLQGEYLQCSCSADCQCMYIDFYGTRAEELLQRFGITPQNRRFADFDSLIPLWRESLSRADEQTIDLASESILIYTFSRLSPATSPKHTVASDIVKLTEERFNDPVLSIALIAEELGYNAKYISHAFKEKMGISYSQYLRTQRIKYAVSLLDNGIDSIKNVALLSGFTDPLYFSTVFKKEIGISPKEYLVRNER